MVKIVKNNPFPTVDVVPENVDFSSVKKDVEQLISELVFKEPKIKKHDAISLTVLTGKRRFKVIRDKLGHYTAELNKEGKKHIQKQIKHKQTALAKYIVNETFQKCVARLEAFKKDHAAKALQKAVKKYQK